MRKHGKILTCLVPAALLALVALAPQDAEAQYYRGGYRGGAPSYGGPRGAPRWGFRHRLHGYIGGQLSGFIVAAQVTEYDHGYLGHGGGGGLYGGVRLGPFVSLEANWNITFHDESWRAVTPGGTVIEDRYLDSIYLMTLTADAKIHIPTRGPVEPFFQGGIGFAFIGATYADPDYDGDTIFAKGPAFNLGGGLDIWLGPWLSVGGRLLYRGPYFTQDDFTGQAIKAESNYVNGVDIDVFLTFHF